MIIIRAVVHYGPNKDLVPRRTFMHDGPTDGRKYRLAGHRQISARI